MKPTQKRSSYKKLAIILLGLIAAGYLGSCVWGKDSASEPQYRTGVVERGDLHVTIQATGTIEPEELVDVGAQVAGQILTFGKNAAGQQVDYGIEVEEGTVLAQIDDVIYRLDIAQAEAEKKRADAEVRQLRARLKLAEADWKRAQTLGSSEALAKSSFDSYQAAYDAAAASVTVGEAAVLQAEATLAKAERNLSYTTITSPVRGVIIDRRVNIGQTVVASLNAPSLFLIAKDLRKMQIWVSVNEADIGSIVVGQPVTFTVDAFPNQEFTGEVGRIRLNASMSQNVVSYVVEVNTDNSNGMLLPYLTANVEFHVTHHENVLLVPNAALRWAPPERLSKPSSGGGSRNATPIAPTPRDPNRGTIWLLNPAAANGEPKEVIVTIGGSDGVSTEVAAPELNEGDIVVIGQVAPGSAAGSGTTNPFAPTMPRGGRSN